MAFDLDAVEHDAAATPFDFTFGGEAYSLPAQVDLIAAAALESGQLNAGLRKMLGEAQWTRICESSAVLDQTKLRKLMEEYAKHVGLSLGESAASTGS